MTALVLLTACSDDDPSATPTATVATEPPTTTIVDPYAIPEVIDEAYVNRVLADLDELTGNVVRLVGSQRRISSEAMERLGAIYIDDGARQLEVDLLQNDVGREFAGYRDPPGNASTRVVHLITDEADCLFLEASRDYSAVTTRADPEASTLWVALAPRDRAGANMAYNPTGWGVIYEGFQPGRVAPENPCE